MVSTMLMLATQKHDGQFDKGGNPYILHPLKVAHKLRTDDQELFCIAIGHDLIEDTDTTYQELKELGMSDRVIEGIKALTKVPGETFEEYKNKVKSNKDAIQVKMQDLLHNSDLRRLKGVTEKDVRRVEKYMNFFAELKELA